MKKTLSLLGAALLTSTIAASSAQALDWVVSPYSPDDGTVVFGETNVVAVKDVNEPESGQQQKKIYGAGFETDANSILFDYDLYTWDSYSDPSGGGNTGWYDAFVVNINQVGYYWDLVEGGSGSQQDPLVTSSYDGGTPIFDDSVLPGVTWLFGGEQWGDSIQDVANNAPESFTNLSLLGGDSTKPYFVSLVLDTNTNPYSDTNYSSWGSFHVEPGQPIPEPATMLLFGSGLAGLAGIQRRRMKKNA